MGSTFGPCPACDDHTYVDSENDDGAVRGSRSRDRRQFLPARCQSGSPTLPRVLTRVMVRPMRTMAAAISPNRAMSPQRSFTGITRTPVI